jgi:hypothetical protein
MALERKTRIMYIERKEENLNGPARIGRVIYSNSGLSVSYKDRVFRKVRDYKANFIDTDTREMYWISGPHRDGRDRLYESNLPIEIDEDVREEYWTEIRKKPELKAKSTTAGGKRRE